MSDGLGLGLAVSRPRISAPALLTANLVLNLDATAITGVSDGANLATWPDPVANNPGTVNPGRPATYHVNQLNGLPIVRMTVDDMITLADAIPAHPSTIYFLSKRTGTDGQLFNFSPNTAGRVGYSLAASRPHFFHVGIADILTATTAMGAGFELRAFTHTGTQATWWRDVSGTPTADGTVANSSTMDPWQGLGYNGFNGVAIDHAHILAYGVAHNAAQLQQNWNVLRAKWGLT